MAALVAVWIGAAWVCQVEAAWNGAGVPEGTGGSDICDIANWENSAIDGDFSTIIETNETVVLSMSSDLICTDVTVLTTNLTCVAGANMIEVSDPALVPGLLVSGGGIPYNTMVAGVDTGNGIISLTQSTTYGASGSYNFIRPAINFNFGIRTTKAMGVTVMVGSDIPGVSRSLTVNARFVQSQWTSVRNNLVFSKDINLKGGIGASQVSFTSESGFISGGTVNPLLTLNGPLDLSNISSGLAMNGGDLTFNGLVSGVKKYILMYQNTKILTLTCPSNTFSGTVMISGDGNTSDDVLRFTSAAEIGQPSALGAGGLIMLCCPVRSGSSYFECIGDEDMFTDKEIRLTGNCYGSTSGDDYRNAFTHILSNGEGLLTLTGSLNQDMNVGNTKFRGLCFGGTGDGVFSGQANLSNVVNDVNVGSIVVYKNGTGTWRFAGTNMNYEGVTHLMAGDLVFDYSSYDQLVAPSNTVVLRGGQATFRGRTEGTTTATVDELRINNTFAYNYVCPKIVLDANGGDGLNVVVTNLNGLFLDTPFFYTLLDLSSHPDNSLTLVNLGEYITASTRGELMFGRWNTQARAVLKTTDGYCFPTINGAKQVVPPTLTALPTSEHSTSTRYLLSTPGTTTLTAGGGSIMSLTIDSNAGDVILDTGAFSVGPTVYAKGGGLLCRGTNNVTIMGTTGGFACPLWSYINFLDPDQATLQLDFDIVSAHATWGGNGFTSYSGSGLGGINFTLCGGIFRLTKDQTLTFSGDVVLTDGGVLEIGADLNGTTPGDFSLACGWSAGKIALCGSAGFSAAGTDRVVNLGGASATLTWGSTSGFLRHLEGPDYGYAFKLSSPRADATLEFQNPIDLNGDSKEVRRRTVDVANGSAAVDAILSGAISGSSTLIKAGDGTLKVTAAQSYDSLRVHAGTFLVDDSCFTEDNAVPVLLMSGATLAGVSGSSNAFGTFTLKGNAVLDVGDGSAAMVFTDSSEIDWTGHTLTIKGRLEPGKVRFGTDLNGLSGAQLSHLAMTGGAGVKIDANGYLVRVLRGTVILVQ